MLASLGLGAIDPSHAFPWQIMEWEFMPRTSRSLPRPFFGTANVGQGEEQ
jgi:hypothetical protein